VGLLLAASLCAEDRNLANYEKVLLPIYTGGTSTPGNGGSVWRTEFWIRNDGDSEVDAFPLSPECYTSSFCYKIMRGYPALSPHMTLFHAYLVTPGYVGVTGSEAPGVFLWVEKGRREDLNVGLRLVEETTTSDSRVTRLPVVFESEFFDRSRSILAIHAKPPSRMALRIYDLESRAGAEVRIRISEQSGHWQQSPLQFVTDVYLEDTLELDYPETDSCTFSVGCPPGASYKPGYIQIFDLFNRYPLLNDARPEHGFRIEITPVTPGLRFWAFVSVTEPGTNDVAIYTP
jgi:hypothetical protein